MKSSPNQIDGARVIATTNIDHRHAATHRTTHIVGGQEGASFISWRFANTKAIAGSTFSIVTSTGRPLPTLGMSQLKLPKNKLISSTEVASPHVKMLANNTLQPMIGTRRLSSSPVDFLVARG